MLIDHSNQGTSELGTTKLESRLGSKIRNKLIKVVHSLPLHQKD